MAEKAKLDLDYLANIGAITKVSGREYLTHPGLLRAAADHGLEGISCEVVHADYEGGAFYMRATVTGSRGTYTGHGDANPGNVGKMIAPHGFRMAETRAVGRALRYYLGLGQTLQCELGGSEPKQAPPPRVGQHKAPAPDAAQWLGKLAHELGAEPADLDALFKGAGRDYRACPPDRRAAAARWAQGQMGIAGRGK